MNFNKTTVYAIMILNYISMHPGEIHSAKSLHHALKIPAQYLRQLMTTLSKNGFIESTRGRSGGFHLRRSSNEIFIGEIVSAIEGLEGFEKCIFGFLKCPLNEKCGMHDTWQQVREIIMDKLNTTSLKTLILNQ